MLILADALILAPEHILRPGRLRVCGRTIREIGADLRVQAGEEILELPGITVAPGFLNLHAHLELTPLHGKVPAALPFAEWLRQILALLPALHSTARTASIVESSRLAAETGTTTILTILSDPAALAGVAGTLPRIGWALELMDLHGNPEAAEKMERLAAWLSRHSGANWQAAISPHAPYSTSSGLYQECGRLSSELYVPLTTHWAESAEEEELFRTGGGNLRPLLPTAWTPGDLPSRLESLPPGTLLVHGNWMTEADRRHLAARRCFIVHCPTSHAWFGRETFPLEKFRQAGLPVVLGTDSPASSDNRCLDLRAEARTFRQAHPQVPWSEIWTMLTTLPARALGQDGKLGVLQPGAEADWVGWKSAPSTDPVAAILESTDPAKILSVAGHLHQPENV